jgi:DNA repair protein RecN (Recombination protein N)
MFRSALQKLKAQQENASKEADYNRFLLDELVELSLKENELEEIDAEYKLLANAGNIKQQLAAVYFELKESEQPLVQQLKSLYNKLHSLEQLYPGVEPVAKRLMSTVIEVQDIADELDSADQSLQLDAERMQQISDRLSAGYKLLKKHGVNDTAGLLSIQESLQQKLDSVMNISSSIETLDKEQQKLYATCLKIAGEISAARSKQLIPLSEKVNKLLAQVGMPNARLKISMEPSALAVHGTDEISFLFDANKSNRFEPLGKVASGGELSRLMLSIKSLVAQKLIIAHADF